MNHSEAGRLGAIAIHKKRINEYLMNPNRCEICGSPIPLNKKGSVSAARKRKSCSKTCHKLLVAKKLTGNSNREKDKRECLNCGVRLTYRQKKYCSNLCQNEFEYKEWVKDYKNGSISGTGKNDKLSLTLKKYIWESRGGKCELCGWAKINPQTNKSPLEIHHIDGDYKNNNENNLQLLCPNCHSLTPNYKASNVGRGREYRRKEL